MQKTEEVNKILALREAVDSEKKISLANFEGISPEKFKILKTTNLVSALKNLVNYSKDKGREIPDYIQPLLDVIQADKGRY